MRMTTTDHVYLEHSIRVLSNLDMVKTTKFAWGVATSATRIKPIIVVLWAKVKHVSSLTMWLSIMVVTSLPLLNLNSDINPIRVD